MQNLSIKLKYCLSFIAKSKFQIEAIFLAPPSLHNFIKSNAHSSHHAFKKIYGTIKHSIEIFQRRKKELAHTNWFKFHNFKVPTQTTEKKI